jgi:hypothetical protein
MMNIGKGGQIATNAYRCGNCGAEWLPVNRTQCRECGAANRVFAGSVVGTATSAPSGVYISGIDLPWGDVFAIAFKFCVVLALFQAVFLIVAVLLWR